MTETTTPDTLPVSISVQVSRQLLIDLLVTAAEGGSNYWARFRVPEGQPSADYTAIHVREHEAHRDDKPAFNRIVKADDLVKGLEALGRTPAPFPAAGQHLSDALSENGDAITADVVLQMAIFGELIYG